MLENTTMQNLNDSPSAPVKVLVSTATLMEYLDCGRKTAVEIGNGAKAQVRIGRRILWNVNRIQEYLDGISR